MDLSNFERNMWRFATLGVTAVVLSNIIMNPRGVVEITRAATGGYVNILEAIRR